MNRQRRILVVLAGVLLSLCLRPTQAKSPPQTAPDTVTIEGTVRDPAGNLVPGATVLLGKGDASKPLETSTDDRGRFVFSRLSAGTYTLRARKPGYGDATRESTQPSSGKHEQLELVLAASDRPKASTVLSGETMALDDKTDFTVAGVTDWSAAGGHGSDAHLRTSEALARDTRGLAGGNASGAGTANDCEDQLHRALAREPQSFALNHQLGELYLRSHRDREAVPLLEAAARIDPANYANAYDLALAYEGSGDLVRAREQVRKMLTRGEKGELDRLAGDLDERTNDPLSAVREYERAAKLDASEESYFDWAAELLVHRAIQPAIEIFTRGSRVYPRSERMLAGLGAALYAGGSFDKAAAELCAASDLSPRDPTPYLFLGKMEQAAPQPLACAEEKLKRFLAGEPDNARANYYYALALVKREQAEGRPAISGSIQALLEKAIAIEPQFADAYLALGATCAAKGDREGAIAAYRKAVELNRNLAEAHFRLAQAYKRSGEALKAQSEFEAYKQCNQTEMAAIERQHREARQFVIVLKTQSPAQ
jgi:tetratricopeptide (TPR) repeat protein